MRIAAKVNDSRSLNDLKYTIQMDILARRLQKIHKKKTEQNAKNSQNATKYLIIQFFDHGC